MYEGSCADMMAAAATAAPPPLGPGSHDLRLPMTNYGANLVIHSWTTPPPPSHTRPRSPCPPCPHPKTPAKPTTTPSAHSRLTTTSPSRTPPPSATKTRQRRITHLYTSILQLFQYQ